jgi:nucleoside-diphosphate-sugar epimerase
MDNRDGRHRQVRFQTLSLCRHHVPMNVILTGANGFIGRALARRLLDERSPLGALGRLTLIDLQLPAEDLVGVRKLTGSIADPSVLSRAFDTPVDLVFHLASIPGGMAEQNFDLGRQVNLEATLNMLEIARARGGANGKPVRVVFASSIAVLGSPLPALVDDATPLRPKLSYGAHKLIGEVLIEDYSRRGWIDGRSIRLPGIVARPPQRTGQLSAFMSDIIRELSEGRPYACPVAADSTTWLMSVHQVLDNFMHAATMTVSGGRTFTLPALRSSMQELVAAIEAVYGQEASKKVTFGSNPALEANFGRYPPLNTPAANAAGFRHDGDLKTLVRRALEST